MKRGSVLKYATNKTVGASTPAAMPMGAGEMDDGSSFYRRDIAPVPQIEARVNTDCLSRRERWAKQRRAEMGDERWAEICAEGEA